MLIVSRVYIILLLLFIKDFTYAELPQKTSWDYTLLGMFTNSSNEDAYQWNLSVERVGRGQYAISGVLDVKVKVTDDFFTELKAYRSATGGSQYKALPFMIPKQATQQFMASTYRNMLMKSLESCSNLPQVVDGKPPLLEIMTYKLNRCILSTEKLPSHMQSGYYKVHLFGTSPVVNYFAEGLFEINNKL